MTPERMSSKGCPLLIRRTLLSACIHNDSPRTLNWIALYPRIIPNTHPITPSNIHYTIHYPSSPLDIARNHTYPIPAQLVQMSATTAPSTGPATVQPAIHFEHSGFSAKFNRAKREFEYDGTLKLHSNMSGTPSTYQAIMRGADGGLSIIAAKRNKLPYDRTNDDETENWKKNTEYRHHVRQDLQ
jgi:hypothetical protein